MKYELEDIEFAITLLSSPQELDKEKVEEWLADSRRRELLENCALLREHYSSADFSRLKQGEKMRLMRKIRASRRRKLYWLSAAASIMVVFSLSLFLWMNSGAFRAKNTGEPVAQKKGQVELILSSGERMVLGTDSLRLGDREEAGILKDSLRKLSYVQAPVGGDGQEEIFNTLVIPVGGLYELELSDGTWVWLNSVSQLRYPVQFMGKERKVYLSGEAYFDVKTDSLRPFIVESGGMNVRVYGTEFNVTAYRDEKLRTTLVQGKVGIKVDGEKELLLRPGQMAEYDAQTKHLEVQEVNTYLYTAWKEGTFAFKDETIEEIMGRLSRWYDLNVFYANEEVKKQLYDGIIPQVKDFEDVLRMIEGTATIHFEIKGNTVIVR